MTQAVGFGFGATFCGSCLLYWCCVYKLTPSTYDTIYIVLLNSRSPLAIRQNVASWPRLCAKACTYCSVRNIIFILCSSNLSDLICYWFLRCFDIGVELSWSCTAQLLSEEQQRRMQSKQKYTWCAWWSDTLAIEMQAAIRIGDLRHHSISISTRAVPSWARCTINNPHQSKNTHHHQRSILTLTLESLNTHWQYRHNMTNIQWH